MMRRIAPLLAALWLVSGLWALATDVSETQAKQEARMNITINGQQFAVTLADNDTARAFAGLLPRSLKMSDLHGNEKYHYLGTSLPSRPENPGRIHAGDLMLFGDDCVVLFYKDFDTSYSYTRIGRLENAAGLAGVVGRGAVTAEFSLGAAEHNNTLKGGACSDTLRGLAGNDLIDGGRGHDKLYGDKGDDTLKGGAGNDTLFGGAGRDVFLFNAKLNEKNNVDVIMDFRSGQDTIQLKKSIFKKLEPGAVQAKNFAANAAGVALDRNDHLIYNTKTGALFYDRDGKGGAAAVRFAVLRKKPRLKAADFLVAG